MPIHDWTRVEAGIFHHFHHSWIEEIQRGLNAGLLPSDYYAMAEQQAAGYGPDVLTLQVDDPDSPEPSSVAVPLEESYTAAWQAVPRRWRIVLEPEGA